MVVLILPSSVVCASRPGARRVCEQAPWREQLWEVASKFCAILALCTLVSACGLKEVDRKVLEGTTMGTSYRLSLNCDLNPDLARQVAEAAFARVDESMSTYKQDSELMRFNRSPIMEWQQVSEEFASVIQDSQEIGSISHGAFDPTIGALVRLWGFAGGEVPARLPAAATVDGLLVQTGIDRLELIGEEKLARRRSDFELDLSAIAKGYAVDLAIQYLEQETCHDLLLEVGGEIGARGTRPGGGAWVVGIESPRQAGGVTHALRLSNEAIATSGDYRNQVVIDGRVYSHTIDPSTGHPVNHGLASVSVISESVMRADALATALVVMGPEEGLAFARQQRLEAFFIIRTKNGYDSFGTGRFDAL